MAALRSFPPGGSLSANAAQIVQKSSNLFIKPKQTEPLPTTEFLSTTVFLATPNLYTAEFMSIVDFTSTEIHLQNPNLT